MPGPKPSCRTSAGSPSTPPTAYARPTRMCASRSASIILARHPCAAAAMAAAPRRSTLRFGSTRSRASGKARAASARCNHWMEWMLGRSVTVAVLASATLDGLVLARLVLARLVLARLVLARLVLARLVLAWSYLAGVLSACTIRFACLRPAILPLPVVSCDGGFSEHSSASVLFGRSSLSGAVEASSVGREPGRQSEAAVTVAGRSALAGTTWT